MRQYKGKITIRRIKATLRFAALFLYIGGLTTAVVTSRQALHVAEKAVIQTQQAMEIASEMKDELERVYRDESLSGVNSESAGSEPVHMEVVATAYCPCELCCGVWSAEHPSRIGTDYVQKTASGTVPTAGKTIATDPDVIPTGSKVVIGNKEYIAEDTGGAVTGNHIDIYFDSHDEALQWGRQALEVLVYEN